MFVAYHFIQSQIRKCEEHPISTYGHRRWYPQSRNIFKVKHDRLPFAFEKSKIERTLQYVKERTECFENYFPCTKM